MTSTQNYEAKSNPDYDHNLLLGDKYYYKQKFILQDPLLTQTRTLASERSVDTNNFNQESNYNGLLTSPNITDSIVSFPLSPNNQTSLQNCVSRESIFRKKRLDGSQQKRQSFISQSQSKSNNILPLIISNSILDQNRSNTFKLTQKSIKNQNTKEKVTKSKQILQEGLAILLNNSPDHNNNNNKANQQPSSCMYSVYDQKLEKQNIKLTNKFQRYLSTLHQIGNEEQIKQKIITKDYLQHQKKKLDQFMEQIKTPEIMKDINRFGKFGIIKKKPRHIQDGVDENDDKSIQQQSKQQNLYKLGTKDIDTIQKQIEIHAKEKKDTMIDLEDLCYQLANNIESLINFKCSKRIAYIKLSQITGFTEQIGRIFCENRELKDNLDQFSIKRAIYQEMKYNIIKKMQNKGVNGNKNKIIPISFSRRRIAVQSDQDFDFLTKLNYYNQYLEEFLELKTEELVQMKREELHKEMDDLDKQMFQYSVINGPLSYDKAMQIAILQNQTKNQANNQYHLLQSLHKSEQKVGKFNKIGNSLRNLSNAIDSIQTYTKQ